MNSDTIAAIATPAGEGGLGIVRISGPKALQISRKLFKPTIKHLKDHFLYHGWIVQNNRHVDEVMLSYMKSPNSYTGEDIIEIYCHGGVFITRHIQDMAIKAGARLAERGEFTKRAYLNGRMDLTKAEAVIDLIKAKTKPISLIAASHLKGSLQARINDIRGQLVDLLAGVEASIDFPDEIGEIPRQKLTKVIERSTRMIKALIRTADAGIIFRDGLSVAILGRPNVGKSSLMNAILRHDRAIVTPEPGTTRDVLEESANIKGMTVRISDTAGVRRTKRNIEKLGIDRAFRALDKSDLVLLVVDNSEMLKREDVDLIEKTKDNKVILVMNKSDKRIKLRLKRGTFKGPKIKVSALYGRGIEKLEDAIVHYVGGHKVLAGSEDIMINLRQKQCLDKALESLNRGLYTVRKRLNDDLIAIDIKAAVSSLGEVTGETVSDEVIDSIFRMFCVGK